MNVASVSVQIENRQRIRPESPKARFSLFFCILLLLIGGAILRSALATRWDSFTLDESYHIAAGVSYVQQRDFRLNPEHPPLVKLWVGSFLAGTGFSHAPLRVFSDKLDERNFTAEEVFLRNDPDSIQRRSRIAMWFLNGSLLVALALALRRAFCGAVALGTILFLVLDPTVAAHLPLVMTDLPVALLAATAVVLATPAFRCWRWPDLIYCSVALGLALGAKHSAPVFALFLAFAGCAMALVGTPSNAAVSRTLRVAKTFGVLGGAVVILWSLYFFRYPESSSANEVFNRPLAQKIADVSSPAYRVALKTMAETHALPRAYIWGFADTVHAGLEGRASSQLAFGRVYYAKAPWYFFPGVLAAKLPITLTLLAALGSILFAAHKVPHDWKLPLTVSLACLVCFLLVLRSGATYAGVRHVLPAIPLIAVFAGIAFHFAVTSPARTPKLVVGLGFLLAAVSALPVMRPWEYFNEIVGGTDKGYLYFSDEGTDLGQRSKELAGYYSNTIEATGEVPLLLYQIQRAERGARKIDWLGRDLKRDETRMNTPVFQGTVIASGKLISKRLWWNANTLRAATPVARFGNLFIFRGNFDISGSLARTLYYSGIYKEYAEKPDLVAAEHSFTESVQADPSAFFVYIELGNLASKRGSREDALQAYKNALLHAPDEPIARQPIQEQIARFSAGNLDEIPILRNPELE
jgi:hypothetical protein